MRVIAFDPFLSEERAAEIGVEKVELDELLKRADFITLHTPMTAQTKNILSAEAIAKTKKGVRIINCARGGLVDEAALREALDSGHVAGAAFDVFAVGTGRVVALCPYSTSRPCLTMTSVWAHLVRPVSPASQGCRTTPMDNPHCLD